MRRNICKDTSDKIWLPKIYKFFLKLNNKKTNKLDLKMH